MKRLLPFLTVALAVALGCAGAAQADAPARSPRPELRPESRPVPVDQAVVMALATVPVLPDGLAASPHPRPRPVLAQAPTRIVLASSGAGLRMSPRPPVRPENLKRRSIVRAAGVRTQPAAPVLTGPRGAVCGDEAIQGQKLSPIAGRLKGCGLSDPVRVTSIDGVALSQPATISCSTATALKKWVSGAVKPEIGRLGGGVASLQVAAHYSCRTRNNQPGAKISEHGRGKAIDIAAINLKNGVSLTVLKGWSDRVQGPILKRLHKAACGPFGTVLGPRSDRFHQDHFHLDTARHRGGAYCR